MASLKVKYKGKCVDVWMCTHLVSEKLLIGGASNLRLCGPIHTHTRRTVSNTQKMVKNKKGMGKKKNRRNKRDVV